tara:strand:+ start:109 stop:1371 length:1263 start_codon:yes stop_codon:yes gene_type:complete
MSKNIGFVSTRFAGTDGVSLESAKWAELLWDDQHVSYWYSGKSDRHASISHCVPEAYFGYSENEWINQQIWSTSKRSPLVSFRIRELADYLKTTLYTYVKKFDLDILVLQNVVTIPMHIPLGIAITEFLAETQMPAIAHHHDFFWERSRFSIGSVRDYLDMAFPPNLPNIRHVVINKAAQEQLSLRKGVSSLLLPNVFNFAKSPPKLDAYSKDLREEMGIAKDDFLILQPTRIVPRKGIEHAIKLIGLLNDPRCKLVISHDAGDEGYEYRDMLSEMAKEENVDLRFFSTRIGEVRQFDPLGKKIYTLWDLYPHADLVTYPSLYEGFGNALLEAIYFKVPVLINRYSIFVQDIEPKGFKLLLMDGFISQQLVQQVKRTLEEKKYRREMVNHNYKVASKFFGYSVLKDCINTHMNDFFGKNP